MLFRCLFSRQLRGLEKLSQSPTLPLVLFLGLLPIMLQAHLFLLKETTTGEVMDNPSPLQNKLLEVPPTVIHSTVTAQ